MAETDVAKVAADKANFEADKQEKVTETARTIGRLITLGRFLLVAIMICGVIRWRTDGAAEGMTFAIWGLIAAIGALLAGMLLGLLFGLPAVRKIEVTGAGQSRSGDSEISTGYSESTSLEQIATFLVTSIVALSLVNFDKWVDRFNVLSANLTSTMMARPPACLDVKCPIPEVVPGGAIVASFALLGFLLGYLWMRRHFISEMVDGRREAEEKLRREVTKQVTAAVTEKVTEKVTAEVTEQVTEKVKDEVTEKVKTEMVKLNSPQTLVGAGKSAENDSAAQSAGAEAIATVAEANLATESPPHSPPDVASVAANTSGLGLSAGIAASRIKSMVSQAANPDDPWKGAFGGVRSKNGYTLSGVVLPLTSDPNFFQVDLLVDASAVQAAAASGRQVVYYLHPTFGSEPRTVTFDSTGKAPLQLFSYGGFTVGALLDDGTTLELDLAELPGAPDLFKSR